MYKPKISVILPSINPDKWVDLYNQIKKSVADLPFEVIAVGPFFPKDNSLEKAGNFRFLRDFGCPSRALQLGASIAQGEYITWFPDDYIIYEEKLKEAVEFLETKTGNDGITVLYSEGGNYSGSQHLDPSYWNARTHKDLQLKWVKDGWKIAPIFIYKLSYFKAKGGLDCRFEHVNMNTHDLAFKFQADGGKMYLSPSRVFAANWHPWGEPKGAIQLAYEENDAPLFKKLYDGDEDPTDFETRDYDFGNWTKADIFWKRRYTA